MNQDNVQLLITIVTALGGIEGIKGAITWYRTRNAEKRKADAQAAEAEISNLGVVVQNLSTQLTALNQRINERDDKIDEIYQKFRDEQDDHRKTKEDLFMARFFWCDMEPCSQRHPPRVKLVDMLNHRTPDPNMNN